MRGHLFGRLPLPLSIAAIVIAGVGVTPVGRAAKRQVTEALFAQNSSAVDGIHASRTPRAGELVPVQSNGRYAPSVVPPAVGEPGPTGVEGPTGPTGSKGAPGGEVIFTTDLAGTSYPTQSGERGTFAQLHDVPAGSWLLIAMARSGSVSFPPNDYSCHLSQDFDIASSTVTAGRGDGGQRFNVHLLLGAVTLTRTSDIDLRCSKDVFGASRLDGIAIEAVRVGSIESRDVDR
jgi:hypothetical protein